MQRNDDDDYEQTDRISSKSNDAKQLRAHNFLDCEHLRCSKWTEFQMDISYGI